MIAIVERSGLGGNLRAVVAPLQPFAGIYRRAAAWTRTIVEVSSVSGRAASTAGEGAGRTTVIDVDTPRG
jgi:hypothetical protein